MSHQWRFIINVVWQIENKHTLLDNREWACVIRQKWSRTIKKINDEMIKHDHENESFLTIFAKSKSESHFSNHISHFETKRKIRYQHIFAATRLNIYSKQIFIWKSSLICIHRNNDSFTEFHQIVQKRKIIASEKVYNRHVFEEKQFTNKTFIFIYYHLLSQKLEHDSIFSWN
jgi:hypothetical protein